MILPSLKKFFCFILFSVILIGCESTQTASSKNLPLNFENDIKEKYWKLKTLNKEEVKMHDQQEREAYFILKSQDNQLKGFGGCSNISGRFVLKKDKKVKMKVFSEHKTCLSSEIKEEEFLNALNKVSTYKKGSDQLILKDSSGNQLASFEAVYF